MAKFTVLHGALVGSEYAKHREMVDRVQRKVLSWMIIVCGTISVKIA